MTQSFKTAFKRAKQHREMENKIIKLAKTGDQEALNYLQTFLALKQFTEKEIIQLRPNFFKKEN